MSFRPFFRRSQRRRRARRVLQKHASRRLRFEAFEDRRMLSFTPGATYDTETSGAFDMLTADLNNDGHLDLVTPSYHANKVSVLLGDGEGGFGDAILTDIGNLPY